MELEVGTQVHYTGDRANQPGRGKITQTIDNRWGIHHLIVLEAEGDSPVPEHNIPEREFWLTPGAFHPGPGQRFWTMEQRESLRAKGLAPTD